MLSIALYVVMISTCLLAVKAQDPSAILTKLEDVGLNATWWSYQPVGGQSAVSVLWVQPTSNTDLLRCVQVAQEAGVHVRVVDVGETPVELYPDAGHILLDMANYRTTVNTTVEDKIAIIPPTSNFESWQIRSASNVRLNEMDMFLIDHGLFLPSVPASGNPTLAELIASAAHGSNWRDDSVSHYVTAMSVISGDGNIWEYDTWNKPDVMSALRACLGGCGIITDITLQVKPLGRCTRSTFANIQLSDLFDTTNNSTNTTAHVLQSLMDNSFSWDISWPLSEPPLDDIIIRVFRLEDPQSSLSMQYEHGNVHLDQLLSDVGVSTANLQETVTGYLPKLVNDRWDLYSNDNDGLEVEFALSDKQETYEGSIRAVQILSAQVDEWYTTRGKAPLHRVHLGWQQRSDIPCYLCPSQVSNISDLVFTINMVSNTSQPALSDLEDFCTQLYSELTQDGFLVFPHLGKHHSFLNTFLKTHLTTNFQDAVRNLTRVRQKYRLDDQDTFVNSYLTTFFRSEYKLEVVDSGTNGLNRGSPISSLLLIVLSLSYL